MLPVHPPRLPVGARRVLACGFDGCKGSRWHRQHVADDALPVHEMPEVLGFDLNGLSLELAGEAEVDLQPCSSMCRQGMWLRDHDHCTAARPAGGLGHHAAPMEQAEGLACSKPKMLAVPPGRCSALTSGAQVFSIAWMTSAEVQIWPPWAAEIPYRAARFTNLQSQR